MTRRIPSLYPFFILLLLLCSASTQARLLIENATILTLAEGSDVPLEGYLLVSDEGLIESVASGTYAGNHDGLETVDGEGMLLIPGFVSGHNHLWQSAFRGIALDGELYPWLEALHYTYGSFLAQGDFYWFTLHGAVDQLLHGITTTYNHSQRLSATEAHYLESLEAEADVGQHFIFAYNNDLTLAPERMSPVFANFMQRANEIMAEAESMMLAASINAVGNFSDIDGLKREIELARQYGISAQIHYLEQYSERIGDREIWPAMLEAGAVGPGITFAHFIHTTDAILADTADRGAAMIWNPLSNGRLASGLADIPRYLELGIPVGMGVDGAASADIADPFENMRMGMYALRMQHMRADIMSPLEILRLHTLYTARTLGIEEQVGSLEAGKQADFLILDPGRPGTGAVFDPVAHIVVAMNAMNIDSVYVAGKLKVKDGVVLDQDTDAIQDEVEARIARIRNMAGE